ncbi:hypothetical protein MEZE111188_05740 [Mesobacillus zeae]
MNLKNCTLGQLLFLARFTEYRMQALKELDERVYGG